MLLNTAPVGFWSALISFDDLFCTDLFVFFKHPAALFPCISIICKPCICNLFIASLPFLYLGNKKINPRIVTISEIHTVGSLEKKKSILKSNYRSCIYTMWMILGCAYCFELALFKRVYCCQDWTDLTRTQIDIPGKVFINRDFLVECWECEYCVIYSNSSVNISSRKLRSVYFMNTPSLSIPEYQ